MTAPITPNDNMHDNQPEHSPAWRGWERRLVCRVTCWRPHCFLSTILPFAILACLLMPNGQIDPRTAVAANPAAKREEGHVELCAALGTFDGHVADLPACLSGIKCVTIKAAGLQRRMRT